MKEENMKHLTELTEAARDEVRFFVDAYYRTQDNRKRLASQLTALEKSGKPAWIHQVLSHEEAQERQCGKYLQEFANSFTIGTWTQSICGIGPVISAALVAHIDITKAPTVGHIWRFAGLDPTSAWNKKEKRPWNADLKKLCWNIGECFVKVSGKDEDVYGKVYLERKLYEQQRNEAGELSEQAATALTLKRFGDDTKAKGFYQKGQLPPAHIHARAKRYAVKLFLAHWHHVAFEITYAYPPPKPYIIEHGGHSHFIAPPNWPMEKKTATKRTKRSAAA